MHGSRCIVDPIHATLSGMKSRAQLGGLHPMKVSLLNMGDGERRNAGVVL